MKGHHMDWLQQALVAKAPEIKEIWLDVDGVMTPQGTLAIYDITHPGGHPTFERRDGIVNTRLVPCDEYGQPLLNVVEYIAGYEGEPIMEGYRFDTRDGKVVDYLVAAGFPVYFISGRNSPCVRKRAQALGAVPLLGVKDKLLVMRDTVTCPLQAVLFIGDGIQDVETLFAVGLGIAPRDASPEAIAAAHAVTEARGGEGVVSEVITEFLKIRGLWPA